MDKSEDEAEDESKDTLHKVVFISNDGRSITADVTIFPILFSLFWMVRN